MVKTNTVNRCGALTVVFTFAAFALLSVVSAQHSSVLSGALTKAVTKSTTAKTATIRYAAPSTDNGKQGSTESNDRDQDWGVGYGEVRILCNCYCRFDGGDLLCPSSVVLNGQCDYSPAYRLPASPNDDCSALNGVGCSGTIDGNLPTAGGTLESCRKHVYPTER